VLADGWPVSSPEQQGLNPDLICAIGARLGGWKEAGANGVVVVRHGAIVYEAYFAGADQRWPQEHWGESPPILPHDAETKHDLQSATKSVVALLAGAALDRGLIKSVDAPLLSFFPEYPDLAATERQRITLRDALTMTAGLNWPTRPYLDMARKTDAAADPDRFVLEQPVTAPPGSRWRYNNGTAELVGGAVRNAVGRPLDQFAKETLFDPLGITDWEWGRMANGDPGASWGLRLRPRDLAKIGQLVLDHGAWQGRQIISADWIGEMTTARIVKPDVSYGYLWWLGRASVAGRDVDWISAGGWGGQQLFIAPGLDLVLVVTAGLYDFDGGGHQTLAADTAIYDFILPAALGVAPAQTR